MNVQGGLNWGVYHMNVAIFFFFKKKKNYIVRYNSNTFHHSGTSASIQYGSGAISGFFSYDDVKVGNLVVKNQVP
jgi:phytepsin